MPLRGKRGTRNTETRTIPHIILRRKLRSKHPRTSGPKPRPPVPRGVRYPRDNRLVRAQPFTPLPRRRTDIEGGSARKSSSGTFFQRGIYTRRDRCESFATSLLLSRFALGLFGSQSTPSTDDQSWLIATFSFDRNELSAESERTRKEKKGGKKEEKPGKSPSFLCLSFFKFSEHVHSPTTATTIDTESNAHTEENAGRMRVDSLHGQREANTECFGDCVNCPSFFLSSF